MDCQTARRRFSTSSGTPTGRPRSRESSEQLAPSAPSCTRRCTSARWGPRGVGRSVWDMHCPSAVISLLEFRSLYCPARDAGNAGRKRRPARRCPPRSLQRRYGDRAVVVPRDAVAGQEHPAAFRRPNPPGLAPVRPDDPAVIARSKGHRPQAIITRSSLEHPVAIHFVIIPAVAHFRRRRTLSRASAAT